MLRPLRDWARTVKRDIMALYLAGRDPRVPWHAKLLAAVTVAYALSPIDLIPDFIPVLGYLDDLVILPLAIVLTVRLIPKDVFEELRRKAEGRPAGRSMAGAVVIVLIWLAATAAGAAIFLSV